MALIQIGKIEGMDKTLKELKQFDKASHEQIIKEIRTAMNGAASLASAKYPQSPMRGWQNKPAVKPQGKAFPFYSQADARKGIEIIIGKKSAKSRRTYKVAALRQNNAGAMIYDMAGSANKNNTRASRQFIDNLNTGGGRASRVLWPAVRAKQPDIIAVIIGAQKKAETLMSANLKKVF